MPKSLPARPNLQDVDAIALQTVEPMELLKRAVAEEDSALLAKLLERHPEIKTRINDPVADFDSPVIIHARSREALDLLLAAGADINAKSRWWAGGFGLLDWAKPELAKYAIERGAVVDVHAAARLGMMDRLRALISAHPSLVHDRSGDGKTPLHWAGTVEAAEYLLDHGADIEARDIDHESTPAQYMVGDRQEVLRRLIQRGCKTDILMGAALGDGGLVDKHLDEDPACIRMSVSERYFPKRNPRSGGTIYIWTLGQNKTAHIIARQHGHENVFLQLMQRSPDGLKLAVAGYAADEAAFKALLAIRPDLMRTLSEEDSETLSHAAQADNTRAVKLMLAAGWPVVAHARPAQTALHWSAFHGNAEMTAALLRCHPPLEQPDPVFNGTPLGWAIYGSQHGWKRSTGDYAATVERLLHAGAKPPEKLDGTEAVQEVLRRHGVKSD
jgi:ankyrin repeat protein